MDFTTASSQFLATQSNTRSPHTVAAYEYAIDLFMAYSPTPLHSLGREHADLFEGFVGFLKGKDFAPATIRQRCACVSRWFTWMSRKRYLPGEFSLDEAKAVLSDALSQSLFRTDFQAPHPPEGWRGILSYYASRAMPDNIARRSKDYIQRWRQTQIRNHCLLNALYETAGRVSEVLQLRVADFPVSIFRVGEVHQVRVRRKAGYYGNLMFYKSLTVVNVYLGQRQDEYAPLFISHWSKDCGAPITRQRAASIVATAGVGVGLGTITPHDFRHWRLWELLNEKDQPIDVVQDYAGHRSVETTRQIYAPTDPKRLERAIKL